MRLDGLPLPPGRLLHPAMWLSDEPVAAGLWHRLRTVQPHTGLWPLLIDQEALRDDDPWDGQLRPEDSTAPDGHDPAKLLGAWWHDHTEIDPEDLLSPAARRDVTAPFGQVWPGLAGAMPLGADPDGHAEEYAAYMQRRSDWRLALVPATRGADALAVAGWQVAAGCTGDAGRTAAVLRDWEHRFGARVVGAGWSTLYVSVAAPPPDRESALRVAAEHFAFCPDNVWQGSHPFTLAAYADGLVGLEAWTFWWD